MNSNQCLCGEPLEDEDHFSCEACRAAARKQIPGVAAIPPAAGTGTGVSAPGHGTPRALTPVFAPPR